MKRRTQILHLLSRAVMCFLCTTTMVFATPMDILEARLSEFQSWSGTFDQTVTNDKGDIIQSVRGALDIQRPLQFHWQTQEPFPQLVISNGDVLWVYDQDLEQVVIRSMDEGMAPLPAAILSGRADVLKDVFKIEHYSEPTQGSEIFQLIPINDNYAGEFDRLTIHFAAGQVSQLKLHDALGQITTLLMISRSDNPIFDHKRFEFMPPAGIDIIDERAKDN